MRRTKRNVTREHRIFYLKMAVSTLAEATAYLLCSGNINLSNQVRARYNSAKEELHRTEQLKEK